MPGIGAYCALEPSGTGDSGCANTGRMPSAYPMSKSMPSDRTPRILRGSRFTTNRACFPTISPGFARSCLRPAMIAEIDSQRDELIRPRDFANRFDGPNPYVHLVEQVYRDRGFDGRGCHA